MANRGKNKESTLQQQIIKYLEDEGAYVTKIHVSSYQSQGVPDLICCYKGYYIAFELKREDNTASKLQEYNIKLIRQSGGIAITAYSLNDVKEVLYDISRIQFSGKQ